MKNNKLPQKKVKLLNTFMATTNSAPLPTDTTTTVTTSITSTHIFNR